MASKKSGKEKEATPSPLGALSSPSAFFSPQSSWRAATLNFTGEEDDLPPLRDVFDDSYVQQLPRGGWKCLYCNKEWKSIIQDQVFLLWIKHKQYPMTTIHFIIMIIISIFFFFLCWFILPDKNRQQN